jgi:hypothetical protein
MSRVAREPKDGGRYRALNRMGHCRYASDHSHPIRIRGARSYRQTSTNVNDQCSSPSRLQVESVIGSWQLSSHLRCTFPRVRWFGACRGVPLQFRYPSSAFSVHAHAQNPCHPARSCAPAALSVHAKPPLSFTATISTRQGVFAPAPPTCAQHALFVPLSM